MVSERDVRFYKFHCVCTLNHTQCLKYKYKYKYNFCSFQKNLPNEAQRQIMGNGWFVFFSVADWHKVKYGLISYST